MKLPSIEYGPVPDPTSSLDQAEPARRRALAGMAASLQASPADDILVALAPAARAGRGAARDPAERSPARPSAYRQPSRA